MTTVKLLLSALRQERDRRLRLLSLSGPSPCAPKSTPDSSPRAASPHPARPPPTRRPARHNRRSEA